MKTHVILLSASLLVLNACAPGSTQSQYVFSEVGVSRLVEFATVIQARPIDIRGENTGAGAVAAGAIGGGAASYAGGGSGQIWAAAGGALAGAALGALAEQELSDRKGIEYVVTTEKGVTKTIVQELVKGDVVFKGGERVMVQTSGSYQRVLPAQSLPTEIARPKGIKVKD